MNFHEFDQHFNKGVPSLRQKADRRITRLIWVKHSDPCFGNSFSWRGLFVASSDALHREKTGDAKAIFKAVLDRLHDRPGFIWRDLAEFNPFVLQDPRLRLSGFLLVHALIQRTSDDDAGVFCAQLTQSLPYRDAASLAYRYVFSCHAGKPSDWSEVTQHSSLSTAMALEAAARDPKVTATLKPDAMSLFTEHSDQVRIALLQVPSLFAVVCGDVSLSAPTLSHDVFSTMCDRLLQTDESLERKLLLLRAWGNTRPEHRRLVAKVMLAHLSGLALSEQKLPSADAAQIAAALRSLESEDSSLLTAACLAWLYVLECETRVALARKVTTALEDGRVKEYRCSRGTLSREEAIKTIAAAVQSQTSVYLKEVRDGFDIRIGDAFVRKSWRIFYEATHPSTHKRQGACHTVGRRLFGTIFIPSLIMCEQVETGVPGEPLFDEASGTWNHHLPLPDHLVDLARPLRRRPYFDIVTPFGAQRIIGPAGLSAMRSWLSLTKDFAALAKLQAEDGPSYLARIEGLGFRILPGDLQLAPRGALPSSSLLYTLSDSSMVHPIQAMLLLFLCLLSALVFHAKKCLEFASLRKSLPLVIGGWGSRGKSGTERLKAALMTGLGYATFSKTTGTEATFLHSQRFGVLEEEAIFRPFGKATIWEQFDLLKIAKRFRSDVFLWECMALTPDYVRILQRGWMKDDLSTITNTYPDHEDIQGPTGLDVAKTICEFIPEKSLLLTTEELMLPLIKRTARTRGTAVDALSSHAIAAVSRDSSSSLPYTEHPANLALVFSIAKHFGLTASHALYLLAEYVRPDIGSLRVYPPLRFGSKSIEFASGFSANEKISSLNNWRACGMDAPGVKTAVLMNARIDRPARCEVFARMLEEDIKPDYVFVVGSGTQLFWQGLEKRQIPRANPNWLAVPLEHQGSPDALFSFIFSELPPDESIRILGMQNIKGVCLESLHAFESATRDLRNLATLSQEGAVHAELSKLEETGSFISKTMASAAYPEFPLAIATQHSDSPPSAVAAGSTSLLGRYLEMLLAPLRMIRDRRDYFDRIQRKASQRRLG